MAACSRGAGARSPARSPAGARACGHCSCRPAGPRRGPGAALRAHPCRPGAPAAAACCLRARPQLGGRLRRACRACRAWSSRRPALRRAARCPLHPPPEPAACHSCSRSSGASPARSRVSRGVGPKRRRQDLSGPRAAPPSGMDAGSGKKKEELGCVRRLRRPPSLHRVTVRLVPAARDPHMRTFLQQLRVEWPAASERAATEALRSRALAEHTSAHDGEVLPPGILGRVCLKELVEKQGRLAGYDPNLDSCLVTEDLLSLLAELQEAVQNWPEDSSPGVAGTPDPGTDSCIVVHVVSCEEEFQQQKLDLLWCKLDDQAPLRQKHLVCGPVKVAGGPGTLTVPEYYELRLAQVCKASALKHGGDLAQDPAWTEIFGILSVATIKFEMLSTAPQSQLLLTLADSSVSTKGTKSGTFVMYNCARLATLFESYNHSMEQGLYPTFPRVSSLDFSLLQDEGEWLLLFNSILPFPDMLSQTAALAYTAPGLHITAHTEMVCKFLVQLSMDFSSYYNRVHVLGEPRPHLFGQMFARLQLLRAVREVLHAGLAMLGLPPLNHI
ncbi:DALR anticodon-binding domain-containing protein 3 isoform X1 [Trichechus manatus latirostris]|uniref:DALR anticodon-binding domain-containing protein 3 isoform X1 n=1 Tax=Trichechus manatus latirostris TaxID=127582 RepID=A0A2Y9QT12_TRIMA|nr:DALR anticodon-binding domain-containing protein 3 isoform X1 [Trichechus manatus latirostris]